MATLNRTFSVKNGIDVANTIIVDSNRNASNLTSVNANSFVTVAGLNVTDQANTARTTANNAYDQANNARNQANTGYAQANAAYADSNTRVLKSGDTMTGNLVMSNNATINANVANISTIVTGNNLVLSTAEGSSANIIIRPNGNLAVITIAPQNITFFPTYADQDGSVYFNGNLTIQKSSEFGNACTSIQGSNISTSTVNASVINASSITVISLYSGSGDNVIRQTIDSYAQANTARDTANGAYGQANGAYSQANGAYAQANGAYAQANGAFGQANGAYAQANGAYTQANGAYTQANVAANTVRVYANSGSELSNKFLNFVNTASVQVTVTDNADGNANISFTTTGAAVGDVYAQANAAYVQANSARNQANSAYAEANLKLNISGGTITGSLVVQGNLEILGNSTTLNVETLSVEDNEIILNSNVTGVPALDGFITINRGSSTNAVLKWDEATDQWKWADGEGTFYAFDAALDAYSSANLAYAQANTARGTANDSYGQANTARGTANDAYGQANAAYGQANTARTQANTAYGQANDAFSQANTARSQANAAYAQANAAYADANTRVLKSGDTMSGTLSIVSGGVDLNVATAIVHSELKVGSLNVTTNTVTTSSSGQVVLDTFGTTEHASAKYFVQVKSGSAYHTTEVVLVQDATNVWLTEYGSIQTGASLGSFSADISSGDVRLLFNADNSVNTIRAVRYGVAPP